MALENFESYEAKGPQYVFTYFKSDSNGRIKKGFFSSRLKINLTAFDSIFKILTAHDSVLSLMTA